MGLTEAEISALEKYSSNIVSWRITGDIPFKKFSEDVLPEILIVFGGTYIAKTVIDNENVWAVLSKRKGKFYYGSYADTLETLLDWL